MPSTIPFLAAPAVVLERAGMGSADSCRHSEKRKVGLVWFCFVLCFFFSWSPVVSPFPDNHREVFQKVEVGKDEK